MQTISIIIITIIISLVLSSSIKNDKTNLRLSSLLADPPTNLDGCTTQIPTFVEFNGAALTDYKIYKIDSDTTYYYINNKYILIAKLIAQGDVTKFDTLDLYTYTSTKKADNKIHDVVATSRIHYELNSAGTDIDGNVVYTTDLTDNGYSVQLRQVVTPGTPPVTNVYATCPDTEIEDPNTLIPAAKLLLDKDHVTTKVAKANRESTITYDTISSKRITSKTGTAFTTYYTKYNNMCTVHFDGTNIYTVYFSTYTNTPTLTETFNNIKSINDGTTSKKTVIKCTGTGAARACNADPVTDELKLKYTIIQNKGTDKELYLYKDQAYYGTNKSAPELNVETPAKEKINGIWAGCLGDIADTTAKVNNISKYKYNIIIIILLSFILII